MRNTSSGDARMVATASTSPPEDGARIHTTYTAEENVAAVGMNIILNRSCDLKERIMYFSKHMIFTN